MISDDQLNSITLTFGFASIVLILVYHAISTNINAYRKREVGTWRSREFGENLDGLRGLGVRGLED
ncbi:hypothetical protein JA9_002851 [Meyerozyma sp. JA9]|nr:hypothetical protein JA9_002851 [Meyerozyma sp. JA9]